MTEQSDTDAGGASDQAPNTDPAHTYPHSWVVDVLASDGGAVALRPIVPEDADKLVEFHGKLSERTRYLRYFGPYPTMSARDVKNFTTVDHHNRVAFVMMLGDEIIAVGRYERLLDVGDGKSAEVAFVVADAHQGRGLGPILLEYLAAAAAENGLTMFVAEVLSENRNMVTVFREAGYQVSRSFDGGVLRLEFAIDPTEALVSVRNSRERAAEARSMGNVLSPRSVAVIGASADPAKVGNAVLTNLLRGGFTGPVYPVNAEHRSVHGVRAYPTVRDIPDDVDLAVVAVPAESINSVLDDCLDKGVKALVVVSSGFSESGPDGRSSERKLVHAARAHGMRLIGPNALGVANNDPAISLNATLAPVLPVAGNVGFFCQSGALGIAILDEAARSRIGLSAFVSAGNRADVSGNDLLQYWDSDQSTEVVLLYLESFGNPRKFSRIARRVARKKPIVAVKSGRHAVPPVLAATGVEIDDSIVRALFEQAGVIQVGSISQLFDCALLFGYQPLPAGPRLAVIGNSTALGVLAADAARSEGLQVSDPVDLGAQASPELFAAAVRDALASFDVDAVIAVFVPPVAIPVEPFAKALKDAVAGSDKPILTTFLAAEGVPDVLAVRDEVGNPTRGSVPSYPGPERAALALARAWRYAEWRSKPASKVVRPAGIDSERAQKMVAAWLENSPGRWLSDVEAAALLECYGVAVVEFRSVLSEDEAVEAADAVGYPVAVKATGEMWRHRPDLGGVRLDLSGPESVRLAYRDLAAASGEPLLHVQKMATKGIGCVVGVQDDPSFGSLISFGLAGVISDLLGDRAYRVLPLTEDAATELIDAPKAAPLLSGYRNAVPVNKGALVDLVQRISALADDIPEVRELACEPVLASATGAEITDSRVRIGPEPSAIDLGPRRLR
ncbi:GNAT family N-acetyltransferase [Rhodococcus sp. WS1]|uniref:bifunctional acetate--CoA ligase family protein/GNAT family N-acetyltransferase n=1 Tax=Rhodococcus TaxID=1827 RepID=UPI000767A6B6|nr:MULTISPECIES: bifunctional GNAT family N-acetyltransferase/acetate--CoA ligase family protein [Rhodococcus]MBO8146718.1 GNAT family N-acetyltransferase [Rhodococcus erythropolis]MBY6384956.1 GNAT family N-acetyltransferase [Rhodococcus erythropolis]MCJ0896261.1 bifunctional GNAT family N-acetyltransferase/acetate--CoA ligase family protein [Rhodococcus sp. ARC_M13]MDO1489665.1 GNAT family N-acetyltransferase [Rhodococcus erythropolis]ROZ58864.1 GNAT family N-acetyltransferase [Rhodococcus s